MDPLEYYDIFLSIIIGIFFCVLICLGSIAVILHIDRRRHGYIPIDVLPASNIV